MAISMADVKALNESTGAGLLACKNALAEANGDTKEAAKILKEHEPALKGSVRFH